MEKNINEILKKQINKIKPSETEIKKIKSISKEFTNLLRKNIDAEIFVGGSLAKKTLIKKEKYDIDIFVRFKESKNIHQLENIIKKINKDYKKIHGSRDYIQIEKEKILIEIIPVLKISKPEQAENVTDLSYFHVNYINQKIKQNPNLPEQIMLAKSFTHAQNCYGAESYIHGFSGYSLELLITHYKTFLNFIKSLAKSPEKEKIIIDDSKFYKSKKELLEKLNKSKQDSPILLIDPTFKERNATSGLNYETFKKFKTSCKKFLKNPSEKFFEKKDIKDKCKNYPFKIKVTTKSQKGNIAGSKLKKFYHFFLYNLKKEFTLKKSEFYYNEKENFANFYICPEKKFDELKKGPPLTDKENLKKFKKIHKKTFPKENHIHTKINHNLTFQKWFNKFLKNKSKTIKEMRINWVRLEE